MLVYQMVFVSLKATFFSMLHGRSGIQTSTKGRCVQSDGKWTLAVLLSFGDDHQSLHRDIQWYIYIINSHYVITFGFPIWDGGPYPIYQDTIYIYIHTPCFDHGTSAFRPVGAMGCGWPRFNLTRKRWQEMRDMDIPMDVTQMPRFTLW